MRNKVFVLIISIIAGIILGGYLGELLGLILPEGAVKTFFTRSLNIGFEEIKINLGAMSLSFGFMIKFNFLSALALFIVVYYFKWWI